MCQIPAAGGGVLIWILWLSLAVVQPVYAYVQEKSISDLQNTYLMAKFGSMDNSAVENVLVHRPPVEIQPGFFFVNL